jgi:hypothetical protein
MLLCHLLIFWIFFLLLLLLLLVLRLYEIWLSILSLKKA